MEIKDCKAESLGNSYGKFVRNKILVEDRVEKYDIITTDELRNAHIIGWKFNGLTRNHIIDFYNLEKFAVRYLYQNRMHEDYKYIGPIKKGDRNVGHIFFCNIDMDQTFTKLGDKIIVYFAVEYDAMKDISLIFRANEIPKGVPDLLYEVNLIDKIEKVYEEQIKAGDNGVQPSVVNYGDVVCHLLRNKDLDAGCMFTGFYYIDTMKYSDLIKEEEVKINLKDLAKKD